MAAPGSKEELLATSTEVGTEHKPYVPDEARMPEFTWSAVLVGAVLGIIFGASSLYLVLKVGMTVSASIPVAVLSITLFRVFSKLPIIRRATILENNIVQTTGSAGESIAFGVGVTMPALMLLGFEMDIGRVMVVSVLGGLLGILMMIPLRRAFIVKKHGELKYPEGTACADVLIVGEQGGASAKMVFAGFGIAFLYQFVWQGLKLWKEVAERSVKGQVFKGANPSIEVNPALLGVGYIIGTRISCVMVAGGVLASFVLIPAIRFFGDGLDDPLRPGAVAISQMNEEDIWKNYVLYIGAGAVAAGGIISLFQALPLILGSIRAGLRDIGASRSQTATTENGVGRTDRDLPIWIVGVGSLGLVLAIWLTTPLHKIVPQVPDLNMNITGAILIVLFGFLFVTVSSRLTGEIGSSSNPISGMTVATLLLTCLIFLVLGWTNPGDRLTALSVAAVVCIAASNGGTTSQDLKTGYLVGATPKWQQVAIMIGALSSALVIGYILIVLNKASTVLTTENLPVLEEPLDVSQLPETVKDRDGQTYHVFRAAEDNLEDVPPGTYWVNDQGYIKEREDPGINGTVHRRSDGTEVQKFKAPKAILMAFITDGILRQRLPWTLVLLGVSIAGVLELCGIPSLPFAVGVYLPLSSSTPIFVGGIIRYVADKWGRSNAEGGPPSESESDMSPGVLLSTGYIAGGSIAGVLIAFLSFSDTIPRLLSTWQFRHYHVQHEQTLEAVSAEIARQELGVKDKKVPDDEEKEAAAIADDVGDLNGELLTQYLPIPAGTTLKLPGEKFYTVKESAYLKDIAQQALDSSDKAQLLFDLNLDHLIHVPKGMALRLTENETTTVKENTTLSDVAKEILGKPARARTLWDLNKKQLVRVPKDMVLQLPGNKGYEVTEESSLGDLSNKLLGKRSKAKELLRLNKPLRELLYPSDEAVLKVPILAGTELKLPQKKLYQVPEDSSLGDVAKKVLGDSDRAQQLWELNKGQLQPEIKFPRGTAIKVPQRNIPALIAFAVLSLFLVLVGLGWLFRPVPVLVNGDTRSSSL